MLKDITLGQFFPGHSVLHKMDPRVKILICVAYIVGIFLCDSITAYIFLIAVTASLMFISQLPIKTILKSIQPVVIIIVFTALLNVFWRGGETLLFSFWIVSVYLEGVTSAIFMMIRITALVIGTCVMLTYTTSPIALTDAIERLLSPLRIFKVPVHEFSMMMTIALRFIPTLIEETDKIMNAQKARGSDFSTGKLAERAKALVPILVPLFISSFRRADDLAVAMECRCYRGGKGRTRMTQLHLAPRDILAIILTVAFIVTIILVNIYFPIYTA
jgi:energy-coupling factor transport system permease protein